MRAFLVPSKPRAGTRIAAFYSLPLSGFSSEEVEEEKRQLTLQAKCSFGAPPPPFCAWHQDAQFLHVPRFYGLDRYGPAEQDCRVDGDAIHVSFHGSLTPVQTKAWNTLQAKAFGPGLCGAIISLPCGFGKTVLASFIIAQRGRKACVLVHKAVLRDQWKACLETFCPGIKVGVIQGTTWQVDGYDVVIAMVMTLAKRKYAPEVFDVFGTVCVDEAHHVAAPVLNQAMRFNARWILGLTATKDRADGLTPLLHWSLGPEGFRAERDSEGVRVTIAQFPSGCVARTTRDGKPLMSIMLNELAKNPKRNAFLADRICKMRAQGRCILVLSDRLEQLHLLQALLRKTLPEEEVGVFRGGMRDADRTVQLQRPVVLCSYGMANEGVDKKEADTLVMATPKGRVIQCVGRVQRPCETKKSPLVLDVVDDVSVFVPLRWKRQKLYSSERYQVQVLSHDAKEEDWFA